MYVVGWCWVNATTTARGRNTSAFPGHNKKLIGGGNIMSSGTVFTIV